MVVSLVVIKYSDEMTQHATMDVDESGLTFTEPITLKF